MSLLSSLSHDAVEELFFGLHLVACVQATSAWKDGAAPWSTALGPYQLEGRIVSAEGNCVEATGVTTIVLYAAGLPSNYSALAASCKFVPSAVILQLERDAVCKFSCRHARAKF